MSKGMELMYKRIKPKIDSFLADVADFTGKDISELTFTNVFCYCVDVLDYVFEPAIKGRIAPTKLLGVIHFTDVGVFILYAPDENKKRVNFSLAHEVSHAILEHNKQGGQYLSQLIEDTDYSPAHKKLEREANFSASILLINDAAIERCIEEGRGMKYMSEHFGISNQALEIRLKFYLMFNHGFSEENAHYTVNLFKVNRLKLSMALYLAQQNQ